MPGKFEKREENWVDLLHSAIHSKNLYKKKNQSPKLVFYFSILTMREERGEITTQQDSPKRLLLAPNQQRVANKNYRWFNIRGSKYTNQMTSHSTETLSDVEIFHRNVSKYTVVTQYSLSVFPFFNLHSSRCFLLCFLLRKNQLGPSIPHTGPFKGADFDLRWTRMPPRLSRGSRIRQLFLCGTCWSLLWRGAILQAQWALHP